MNWTPPDVPTDNELSYGLVYFNGTTPYFNRFQQWCSDPPGAVIYPSKDSDGSFTVSWSAVADATGYTLERAQDASFTSDRVILYNGSSTSCAETDLARGIYYYRVKAQNSCGGSIWQTGSSIKVKISILPPWLMLLLGS